MSDVAPEIKVGDTAPDFNLKDQDQQDVKLSDYRGKKNVVLCFYPRDDTPGCVKQACQLRDGLDNFFVTFIEVLQDRAAERSGLDFLGRGTLFFINHLDGKAQAL